MQIQDRQSKRGNVGLLVALVVLSLVLVTVHFREGDSGPLHSVRRGVAVVAAPVSRVGEGIAVPFRAVGEWFAGLGVSRSEVEALRQQNDELRGRLAELEEARQENERLRALVDFAEERKFTQLGARVIGRPSSSWEGVIVIDRGTADGVRAGMPVLAAQGLVGQIVETAAHSARVRLITDQQSGVAGMLQSSRVEGIVQGSIDRTLSLNFVSKDSTPTVGDVVITSGLGGVYPKGLVVGDVTAVDSRRADLYPRITLASRVPVDALEEVLVLVAAPAEDVEAVE